MIENVITNRICKLHPRIYKMKPFDVSVLNILSFSNLLNIYRKEIIMIMKGKSAKHVFNEHGQDYVIKNGLIFPCSINIDGRFRGTRSYPTCLTRMILTGMIEIDREKLLKEIKEIGE